MLLLHSFDLKVDEICASCKVQLQNATPFFFSFVYILKIFQWQKQTRHHTTEHLDVLAAASRVNVEKVAEVSVVCLNA